MVNNPMVTTESILGRSPETLEIAEQRALAGSWIALEVYSPETTPLRVIEAAGSSVPECIAMLRRRGLDPGKFEFSMVKPPY